jgi:ribonuclease E
MAAPVVAETVTPVSDKALVLPAETPAPAAPATPANATPASLPPVASYTLQIDSLQQVAQGSGLVWVNSDASKVAAVQAAIAAEPQPARVPRERPPAVVLNEGPLVLVETRKDLKDLNLPF